MVKIQFSIGGLSMENHTIDMDGISNFVHTVRYIKSKLKAFGYVTDSENIKHNIHCNHGFKYVVRHKGQRLAFDIYRD